jgi:AraC-like DNA-binding protein
MVSQRCKLAVKAELEKLGLHCVRIDLFEAEIEEDLSTDVIGQLRSALLQSGLELIEDHRAILVEKIKVVVIETVHYSDELPKMNFSDYLSRKLNRNYTYLANLFSEVTGNTIEHFIISHKIERAKEMLLYDELNITEISYKLHYSSVAHLSNQFKKITGLTPTFYKNSGNKKRTSIENV